MTYLRPRRITKLVRILWLASLVVVGGGCMKLSGEIVNLSPDFKKSQVKVSGTALANGTDQLIVYAHLLNSNNTPVAGFTPTYNVTSGAQLIGNSCFTSDNNGLSICIFKSTYVGTSTIEFDNIKNVDLKAQVSFLQPPSNNNQIQAISGSDQKNTAGPYSVKGSIGNVYSSPKQTAGNYVLYGSVQGSLTSQSGGAN